MPLEHLSFRFVVVERPNYERTDDAMPVWSRFCSFHGGGQTKIQTSLAAPFRSLRIFPGERNMPPGTSWTCLGQPAGEFTRFYLGGFGPQILVELLPTNNFGPHLKAHAGFFFFIQVAS